MSFCQNNQNVIFCPSKKPFFAASSAVEPKKGRNLEGEKKRFAFFFNG
jgi:hypothetical protein